MTQEPIPAEDTESKDLTTQPGESAVNPAVQVGAPESVPEMAPGPEIGHRPAEEGAAAPDIEALWQELEIWKQKAGENQDLALRARAETENLRKRTARDVENAHRYALDRFVNELLPVIDSMELGIVASQSVEDLDSVREGLDLTLKMFLDALQKFGVAAINPLGARFDPEKHQAVSAQAIEGSEPGTIVTVMQKGYELNGRLVRPAMVVVAK